MRIPLTNVAWLGHNRSNGEEFLSVYKNGQVSLSANLIRAMGGDPATSNFMRAGQTPEGDMVIQFIPQAEYNKGNGATWKLTKGLTSLNVKTHLGWEETGCRYRYDVDHDQRAILVYHDRPYRNPRV